MIAPVIHAEALSKRYRRGFVGDPGLRHALENFLRSPLAALRRPKAEMFWALQHVSLDVHEPSSRRAFCWQAAAGTWISECLWISNAPGWEEAVRHLALQTNRQRPAQWIDYFVFSKGLYYQKIPEFVIGRPGWQ